jgi:transposase
MDVVNHHSLTWLQLEQRREKDVFRARNLQIIVLAVQGWTAPAVAMAVGLSRRVVQSRIAEYNEHGVEGLSDQRGAPLKPILNEEEQATFIERIEAGPRPTDEVCSLRGRDFQRILEEEFGKRRSLASIYNFLHRLGYSYLKPRPRHEQADPEAQAAFVRDLPARIAEIAKSHPGKKLRIYFQDEARFGQQGSLTNVWAARNSRATAVRQTAYKYVWVFAAVCPETGASEGLIAPRLATESVNAFLELFSKSLPADEHAIMIWDGAGFHKGRKLQMPENITPITLPAYSPELNPIENLWHYLKSHHWSNRSYADADALEKEVMSAWRTSVMNAELMQTVCSAEVYRSAEIR